MEQNPFIEIGLPISLIIIMIGMGLSLSVGDFHNEAKAPRGVIVGSLAQIVAMPALGFLIAWALALSPALAVGLVIIAACPGGATSNVITFLARGNVALSICLTAIASLVTIITLPLYVNVALRWQLGMDADVQLPVLKTIIMLTVMILIPVGVGMLINAKLPALARRAEKAVNVFGALVLLTLIIIITYSIRDRLVFLLVQAGLACAVLTFAGIVSSWVLWRITALSKVDALTIGVELGIKNATVGILVAATLLKTPEMAMPSAMYALLMYTFGFGLISYGRRLTGPLAVQAA